ncbi:hypothetical protein [Thaumasiovibrio subtropicus]|uniref:hypothetical protein n=1 Tax=Thaumasiovibrio subtropicus TaxID=1891207 RepID=UPI000B354DDC|nr:hypothetical protein [Thaumasiovibrio subtropicus]
MDRIPRLTLWFLLLALSLGSLPRFSALTEMPLAMSKENCHSNRGEDHQSEHLVSVGSLTPSCQHDRQTACCLTVSCAVPMGILTQQFGVPHYELDAHAVLEWVFLYLSPNVSGFYRPPIQLG